VDLFCNIQKIVIKILTISKYGKVIKVVYFRIPKSKGVCWERLNSHCDFNYLNLDGAIPAKMAVENDFGNYKFWTSLPINEGTQRKHNLKKGRFYNKARYYY